MAKKLVSDNSDDEDEEYKGHFCSECSIPPPGGVRGWVHGYGGSNVSFSLANNELLVIKLGLINLREGLTGGSFRIFS